MTRIQERPAAESQHTRIRTPDDIEAYVSGICFKTGPPSLTGVELEWTVHHHADPSRPLDPATLTKALGPHTPPQLDPGSPHLPLPGGGTVTVEPGGQVEISTPPHRSLSQLRAATGRDLDHLTTLLSRAGLVLGATGIDPHRPARRLLHTPRYDAMAAAFARHGPHGLTMMCRTAGLQICVDVGGPDRVTARWQALHDLGPVLLAAFANSRQPGWASARMTTWFGIDPERTRPAHAPGHRAGQPVTAWTRYALRAPVLFLRDPHGGTRAAPPGVTFGDWLTGAIPRPATTADLELHLSTLFPPVRPRGYFEVRYLDAQQPADWFAPVAALTALLAREATVDRVRDLCQPVAGQWRTAARHGLADRAIRRVAGQVLDLACRELARTDLTASDQRDVSERLGRRLTGVPEI